MVTDSVVVFVVRKGNPKNIKTWDDLTKAGVEVINPNPFTSGGARWNVMAAYGAQIKQGKTEDAGRSQYLNDLYKNVAVQDDSARKALQTFTGGKGDVLLAYENEAIFAQQKGEEIDYVVPDQTILIENPVAVTTDGAKNPTGQGVLRLRVHAGGAEDLRRERLPPGRRRGRGRRERVPDAARRSSPSPTSAAGTTVMTKFFDPEGSIMADVERGHRSLG